MQLWERCCYGTAVIENTHWITVTAKWTSNLRSRHLIVERLFARIIFLKVFWSESGMAPSWGRLRNHLLRGLCTQAARKKWEQKGEGRAWECEWWRWRESRVRQLIFLQRMSQNFCPASLECGSTICRPRHFEQSKTKILKVNSLRGVRRL